MKNFRLLLSGCILVISLLMPYQIEASLTENWESGAIDSAKWTAFGSPTPQVVAGGHTSSYAFDPNSDTNYFSGVYSKQNFKLSNGFKMEFWLKGVSTNRTTHMRIMGGISDNVVTAQGHTNLIAGVWLDCPNMPAAGYLYFVGGESFKESYVDDGWHKIAIKINLDGTVSFYRDGILKFTSSSKISFGSYDNQAVQFFGNYVGMLIDDISISENDGSSNGSVSSADLLFAVKGDGTFTQTDMQGTWRFFTPSSEGDNGWAKDWFYGYFVINSTGQMTSGQYNHSDYTSGAFIAGSITISGTGSLSGSVTTNLSDVFTIVKGNLDSSKKKGIALFTTSDMQLPLYFIKDDGVTYTCSNLFGIWDLNGIAFDYSPNSKDWTFYGNVQFNSSCSLVGGALIDSLGNTVSLTSSDNTFIASNGLINGGILIGQNDRRFLMRPALIRGNEGVAVIDAEEGFNAVMLMTKREQVGTQTASDLVGQWNFLNFRAKKNESSIIYGNCSIALSGNSTAIAQQGSWTDSRGGSGIINSGSWNFISKADNRGFTGNINDLNAIDLNVLNARLSYDKKLFVASNAGSNAGQGFAKIGVFRPSIGMWFLDRSGNGAWNDCATDKCINFGIQGDLPVTGDWNGDGTTKIGVFRPSIGWWFLDYNGNGQWDGCSIDRCYNFGISEDTPVTGDWNGDGKTEIGVFRKSIGWWFLDYNADGTWSGCSTDRCFNFGISIDTPVTGDWNGDGKTEIGVFRPSIGWWFVDVNGDGAWSGCGADGCYNFGISVDLPVTGDWNGDGYTEIGVYRPSIGMWFLDYNGNDSWNDCTTDRCYQFGISVDLPVSGAF